MKKKLKKLLVLACLGCLCYVIGRLLKLDAVQDKLFEVLGEDRYLKIEGITRTAGDILMWPVHYVKALLP